MAEEGEPSTTQLLWGLHMNFDSQEVKLPEPKRIKSKYLLGHIRPPARLPGIAPAVIAGAHRLRTVLDGGVPRAYPSLAYPLLSAYKGNTQGSRKTPCPKGAGRVLVQVEAPTAEEEERRWEDFWDALDFIRLQLEAPLQCSFTAVFEKLWPIRERLALPGVTARARITGGDATLDRIGAVDWKAKIFHAERVDHFWGRFETTFQGRG